MMGIGNMEGSVDWYLDRYVKQCVYHMQRDIQECPSTVYYIENAVYYIENVSSSSEQGYHDAKLLR